MIKSKDVLAIGIWGMGGIGKTTLACMIFDKMEGEFDNAYFQKNVREELKTVGLFSMQKKLLSNILNDECTTLESIFTKKRLRCKKILIVLDDVTSFTQKEELIGNFEHFSPESRIIITSRDKQVLQNCGIIDKNIYEVKGLQDDQGLRLFSRYAFEQKNPPQDYMELSKRVVKFVKGVPLALKVFGSMLFQKSKATWESLVLNIERISILEIQDVLKLSYDELNDDEKNIFLDISCFLKDVEEKHVMEILEANGLASKAGIDVLFNKSLITTSIFYNDYVISMHDLLQEMGRKIVKEESKDPGKRSRLWHHEDICRILSYGTGTETVEAIHLDISKIRNINLNPFAFSKMPYLRSLDIFPSSKMSLLSDPYRTSACQSPDGEENENKVLASQGLNFISAELRYLRWFKYPLKSLPSTFDPGNLVLLVMPHSEIEQLGNGVQHFNKVKIINLSHSKHLNRIPDLSLLPNLECLILDGCSSLTEIHSSRRYLRKLVLLNLRNCKSLIRLPPSLESNSLTYVDLSGCSRLEVAPKMSCSVEEVYLSGTSIKQLPLIESPSRLRILWLNNCSRLESIPSTICDLPDLERLSICGCSKIERLPYNMGNMKNLCSIEADYIALRELPPCIKNMDNLKLLSLQGCKGQELVDSSLSRMPCSAFLLLNLSNCEITKLPDSLGQLSSLTVLNLSGNKFERIPANIRDLTNLLSLDVSYCEKLQSLPKLPSFLAVQAHNCASLEGLPDLSFVYRHWTKKSFNLANCFKLNRNALKAKVESSLMELQSEVSLLPSLAPFHRYGTAATMCYPGNEIPEFFSFQKVGSSITLELPLDCMKKSRENTVKFVACVVVTFGDHHPIERTFPVHFNCKTEGKFGKMKYEFSGAFNCLENEFKMSFLDCLDHSRSFSMKSDHVFLWYDFQFPKDWLPRENGTKSFNRVSAVPIKWKEIEEDGTKNVGFYDSLTFDFYIGDDANDYIVEKCGVRLLFDPDEQEEPAKRKRKAEPRD